MYFSYIFKKWDIININIPKEITMNNVFDGIEMPMGLGMALAKNVPALDMFSNMDASQKQAVIDHTHQINSKNEMHEFVREIAEGKSFM